MVVAVTVALAGEATSWPQGSLTPSPEKRCGWGGLGVAGNEWDAGEADPLRAPPPAPSRCALRCAQPACSP